VASSGRRQRLVIRRVIARNDPNVKLRPTRAQRQTTRQQAISGTVPEAVAMQASWRHMARNNLMLEGEAVQGPSIELLGEASSRWCFELWSSLPGMRAPPRNMLPAIRVDRRRATCHLTPSTAWGSMTNLVEMVMSPEADDQLRPPSLPVVAPGTLVRPWWWRG
jgi:hypothetical protein